MATITPSTAITLVRRNLDEAGLNESLMYTAENNDNLSLDDIIRKTLPEAINAVHLAAPVTSLEGSLYGFSSWARPEGEAVAVYPDGVLEFSPSKESAFLRLVEFKAVDSAIVLTDALEEASAEGRKQLNPHIRGRYDRPRLVREQGRQSPPRFRYYTLRSETLDDIDAARDAISRFSFVSEQRYSPSATEYTVSALLRQNVIDQLTAMVLAIYGDQARQQYFQTRASAFA